MSKVKQVRRVVKSAPAQVENNQSYILFAVVRGVPVMRQCPDLPTLVEEARTLLPHVQLGSLFITAFRGEQLTVSYNNDPGRPQFKFVDPVSGESLTTETVANPEYTELVAGFVAVPEAEETESSSDAALPELPGFADDLFGLG